MALKNFGAMAKAGIPFGMGTDSGPTARFPGYFAHWELELMVKAGVTPLQALTAATTVALHPAADQIADFGALADDISVTVTQISARFGAGRGRDSLLRL